MTSRCYDAPIGKVGQRFVVALAEELNRVQDIQWNLEWFIVFQTLILQPARHVTAYQEIY